MIAETRPGIHLRDESYLNNYLPGMAVPRESVVVTSESANLVRVPGVRGLRW